MIEDILDASRLQIGELLQMDMITMNIVTLVENVLSELRLLHGDHFILISPKEIRGKWNEDGIRRIIENLCNNAIKYGYAHSPITVTLTEANHQEVELSVHNFGDAIPPSELNKLFELYSRVNTDKHSEKIGWGIGLSIVKGIAEAHQGRVEVSSTTNTGTTFKVTLSKYCS
jgi:signal transduction histidine kinase